MKPTRLLWKATLLVATVASVILSSNSTFSGPNAVLTKPVGGAFMDGRLPSSAPVIPSDFEVRIAFTNLTFQNPMGIVPVPGSNRLAVWEREGKIWTFENDPAAVGKTLILDLTVQCQGWGASGIFSFAFHPGFATNGWAFVYYTWVLPGTVQGDTLTESPELSVGNYHDRISRFTLGDQPPSLDSEVVLIDQITDSTFHSGGSIFFHPTNGFLYWCNGDDFREPTQIINQNLLSGVFRIDVDQRGGDISHPIKRQPAAGTTANYFIPKDNPFVGITNALEEFYALGLRNPYRMSIDPNTLRIFIGDVGNFSREEINTIEPSDPAGLNFQWAQIEGAGGSLSQPYVGVSKGPYLDYDRSDGGCIIGGYVYRGTEFAEELAGRYIFGDNSSAAIWVLDDATLPPKKIRLASLPYGSGPAPHRQYRGLSSFGLDQNGELLICQLSTTEGRVYKLARRGAPPAGKRFPARLSETGVFQSLTNITPSTNLIPYDVNSPLWSDGAHKSRWFAIPANTTIGFSASGEWQFPPGSVFVKHFEMENAVEPPRRLETRVLVRSTEGGVFGATYKWRPDHSDADLLDGPLDEEITVQTSQGQRTQTWHYPSPNECLQCHTPSTKGVLGLNTRQINRAYVYHDGISENQLKAYNDVGLFFPSIGETDFSNLPQLTHITNSSASLEHRARSHLDSNCSHCHRPGEARAYWDARFETPLQLAGILNGTIAQSFDIEGAKAVVPGHPEKSIIQLRASSLSPSVKMPPIGRNVLDEAAIAVLSEYITSLPETTNSLPAGWQTVNIGPMAKPGSATFSSDALSMTSGSGDIWGNADTFTFAYQQMVGDGEIVAQVASTAGSESARVGIMLRTSLEPNSANAYISLLNRRGVFFCNRKVAGGFTTASSQLGITTPAWLRIKRTGNVFTAFYKFGNATDWTEIGEITIEMPTRAYVGFAATGSLSTGDFILNNISCTNVPALNLGPTITLNALTSTNGAVAGPLVLQAEVADTDGQPAMVEFFTGDTRIGQATSAPFQLPVNAWPGEQSFYAKVYDDLGAKTLSSEIQVSAQQLQIDITPSLVTDAIKFSHRGNPGIAYSAEGSLDLMNWTQVSTGSATNGTVSHTVPISEGFRFFRIRPR
jgi:uncharacterized repeat protein (TIGR03806 family)